MRFTKSCFGQENTDDRTSENFPTFVIPQSCDDSSKREF